MAEQDQTDMRVGQGSALGHNSGTQNNNFGNDAIAAALAAAKPRPTHNFTTPEAQPAQEFIGREKELADLHTALVGEAGKAVAITQAIVGEGGIGKSAVAREYAIRFGPKDLGRDDGHAGHYGGVWWIAASDEALTRSAEQLARVLRSGLPDRLAPEDVEQIIREELAKKVDGRGHLLILDNLESDAVLSRFKLLPHSRVLATTKRRDLPIGLAKAFELGVMSPKDAIGLLKRGREAELGTTHDAALAKVAQRLGWHALALGMANAWLLRKSKPSPKDLLARLEKGDAEMAGLLSDPALLRQLGDYAKNVVDALSLHWKGLTGTDSMKILRCAAFCAPDRIPADLLADAAEVPDPEPALEQIAALGIGTLERVVPKDPRGYDGLTLSLHRLMQVVLRHQTLPEDREAALRAVVDARAWPFRDCFDHTQWPKQDFYCDHGEAAFGHAVTMATSKSTGVLGCQLGRVFAERGQLRKAEMLLVLASTVLAEHGEPDDPLFLASLTFLAGVWRDAGRPEAAERLHSGAFGQLRLQQANDSPEVAGFLNNQAHCKSAMGKAAEAEQIHAEALAMRRRLFPGDNAEVAQSLCHWASALAHLERLNEAAVAAAESLAMRRRLFAGDHPDIAHGLNAAATIFLMMRRANEAEPMCLEALEMRRRLHACDHPHLACSLNTLALAREMLGRAEEAEPMYAEAVTIAERVFGPEHSETKSHREHLERCREELGK